MKKFIEEFKEFALQGDVMSMAVGIIIGAAFQSIVSSLTDNLISPLIGIFTRESALADLSVTLFNTQLKYGAFIMAIINFLITALIVFLLVKGMNKLVKSNQEESKEAETETCPYCLTEIPAHAIRCPHCTTQLRKIGHHAE